MTLGDRIKELRISSGLSMQELADKLNIAKQTVYKYKNGIVTNIPSDKIEAMAKLFNVSPQYIMGWDTPAAPAEKGDIADLSSQPNGEQQLIDLYRQLNSEGQEKVTDYADDLVNSGKYKKSDTNENSA